MLWSRARVVVGMVLLNQTCINGFTDRLFTERDSQFFWSWCMWEPWCLGLFCRTLDCLCIFQRSWLWSFETVRFLALVGPAHKITRMSTLLIIIDTKSCQDVSRMCESLLECEQRRFSVPKIHAMRKNSGRNGIFGLQLRCRSPIPALQSSPVPFAPRTCHWIQCAH